MNGTHIISLSFNWVRKSTKNNRAWHERAWTQHWSITNYTNAFFAVVVAHIGNFYYFRVCICSPAYSLRLLLIWWECHVLVWCIHHSYMYEIFPHCNEPHILPLQQQQQWHIWTIDNKKIINKLTTTTVGPTAEIYGERK